MSKCDGIFTENFTSFFSIAGKTENVPVSPQLYTPLRNNTPQYLLTGKYLLADHNFPGKIYSWESFFPGK